MPVQRLEILESLAAFGTAARSQGRHVLGMSMVHVLQQMIVGFGVEVAELADNLRRHAAAFGVPEKMLPPFVTPTAALAGVHSWQHRRLVGVYDVISETTFVARAIAAEVAL